MRVVETETTPTYKMGKSKKHKLRKKNEGGGSDSSEEGMAGGLGCTHVTKAVNLAAMRKAVSKPSVTLGECGACSRDKAVSGKEAAAATGEDGAETSDMNPETTIWVCLQCGHQGCDRNSKDKHALVHYETPHSCMHCIVVNLTTWTAWCYVCDDHIPLETSKRVHECVDLLRKMSGLPRMDSAASGRRARVEPVLDLVSEKDKGRPTTPRPAGATSSCQKVKGLSNLGNTCFFNAVMQNLSQTHSLETVLVEKTKKGRTLALPGRVTHSDSDTNGSSDEDSEEDSIKDLSGIEITTPDAGPLTQVLLSFLQEMNNMSSRNSTVNPSSLFGQICKKAPRFKGFQQQDSHELLRYLLDVIRTEEVKRGQSGILKHFKLHESTNPKKVDDETKTKIKEYGRQVKHTFLDSLFGGQLVSTVMCEECKHVSQIFEPFLDLSLPVTEEKPLRPNLILGGRRKENMESSDGRTVERSVECVEKPSKHQEKKNRKLARKDAKSKRRGQKLSRQKSWMSSDDATVEEGASGTTGGEKMTSSLGTKIQEDEGEESGGSAREEDQSDADVEDNLESDTSRLITRQSLKPSLPEEDKGQHSIPTNHLEISMRESLEDEVHTVKTQEVAEGDVRGVSFCDTSGQGLHSGKMEDITGLCKDMNGLTVNDLHPSNEENAGETVIQNGHDASCREETEVSMNGESGTREEIMPTSQEVVFRTEEQNGVLENSECGPAAAASNHVCTGESGSQTTLKGDSEDAIHCTSQDQVATSILATPGEPVMDPVDRHSPNQIKNKAELKRQAQYRSMNSLSPRYHPSAKECSIQSCLHQFTSAELLTGSNKFGCKQCTKNKRNKMVLQQKEKKQTDLVYSSASKQYHVFVPPAILTLHLKRFEQVGFTSRKVNRHVEFPFVLDLAPYCSSLCQGIRPGQKRILYSLYGVVEHSGRLSGGHYTAYIKVRPSLAPLTNYLNTQVPTPWDYIHNYTNRMLNGPRTPTDDDPADDSLEGLVPPGKWYHISDSRVSEVQESHVQRAQAYLLFYERIY